MTVLADQTTFMANQTTFMANQMTVMAFQATVMSNESQVAGIQGEHGTMNHDREFVSRRVTLPEIFNT